jgi:hypothetical protein
VWTWIASLQDFSIEAIKHQSIEARLFEEHCFNVSMFQCFSVCSTPFAPTRNHLALIQIPKAHTALCAGFSPF